MISQKGNQILIKINNQDKVSNTIILGGVIIFLLGVILLVLDNLRLDGYEIVTFPLFINTVQKYWKGVIVNIVMILGIFFIFRIIFSKFLDFIYGFFPYNLYTTVSYALSVLLISSTLVYDMLLIEGLSFIFASIWFVTDGFSHKYYGVNIKINKSSGQIEYVGKFSGFLFFSTKDRDILLRENQDDPYHIFIRVKGHSILDQKIVQKIQKTKRMNWDIQVSDLLEELPHSNYKLLKFECFMFFNQVVNNGRRISNYYVPLGKFDSKDELLEFLNDLSNIIEVNYSNPDISKIFGKNK